MELICETEFSFVQTARIKPPFIGSRTSGKKVYLRQVESSKSIALKVNISFLYLYEHSSIPTCLFPSVSVDNYISDHFAITFDQEHGFAQSIAWSGHVADAENMPLLEHGIITQFKGCFSTLTDSNSMIHSINFQGLDKPGCHRQLHPKTFGPYTLRAHILCGKAIYLSACCQALSYIHCIR
jgi:hypothetical protein